MVQVFLGVLCLEVLATAICVADLHSSVDDLLLCLVLDAPDLSLLHVTAVLPAATVKSDS
jgi:hypothetical protein